jgi:hypothetical protein
MRGRQPDKFVLKPKDKTVLRKLLRDGHTPLRVARRAEILLHRAKAQQRVCALGEAVERDAATIWRVCERYRQGGLDAALYDAPRSGRPPVFFPPRVQGD